MKRWDARFYKVDRCFAIQDESGDEVCYIGASYSEKATRQNIRLIQAVPEMEAAINLCYEALVEGDFTVVADVAKAIEVAKKALRRKIPRET